MHSATTIRRAAAIIGIVLAAHPVSIAAQQQRPALDTNLMAHVARKARQKTTELQAGAPAPNPAAAAQYREALSDIERGDLNVAATELTAALQRAQQNA